MIGLWQIISSIIGGIFTAYNKSKDVTIATVQASVGIATAQAQAMSHEVAERAGRERLQTRRGSLQRRREKPAAACSGKLDTTGESSYGRRRSTAGICADAMISISSLRRWHRAIRWRKHMNHSSRPW